MRKSLIVLLLAVSSLPLAAQAKPGDSLLGVNTVAVPYGDLNLSHPIGAQTMLRRIKAAATEVCGAPGSHDLRERRDIRHCMRDAVENALAQLRAPLVTALYQGREVRDEQVAVR